MTGRTDSCDPRVLVVDEDGPAADSMESVLASDGCEVVRAADVDEAAAAMGGGKIDVVVASAECPGGGARALLEFARRCAPEVKVILTASGGTASSAMQAIRQGACDYLVKPVRGEEVLASVRRAVRRREGPSAGAGRPAASRGAAGGGDRQALRRIIGADYRMLKVLELAEVVAASRATVLITGESGTGKSMVARAIHEHSPRRGGAFVEVSCGALPEALLASELFGHVRGAFTDAGADRTGKFAAADGGTIFLDEVAGASPALQLKLLRILQERTFEPVGSNRTRTVDARVILASNRDLWAEVEAGRFRRDLYYRVNVVNIELPPLRERTGDVALLAEHFLELYQRENGKIIGGITAAAVKALEAYYWPGNVRELANAIERAVVLCRTGWVNVDDLPPAVVGGAPAPEAGQPPAGENPPPGRSQPTLAEALAEPEKRIILNALAARGGSRQATADALGINRTTLYKKMKKYGLLGRAGVRPRWRARGQEAAVQ